MDTIKKWLSELKSEVPIFIQLCRTIVQLLKKGIRREDTTVDKVQLIVLQKQSIKMQIAVSLCLLLILIVVSRGCGKNNHTDVDADRLRRETENDQQADKAKTVTATKVPRQYCVIDLSEGVNATTYPITYLDSTPRDGWTEEYKTTKLVMRLVEPGTFTMGHSDESNNKPHLVTLTKPYYIGVFEITQMQYELVMGEDTPMKRSFDNEPVREISYDMIRGCPEDSKWSSAQNNNPTEASFMGKLRMRTGIDFDLPTEAQWEYACRAGTVTKYYWGDSMDEGYAWFYPEEAVHSVGEKKPNCWGLYDMSGNVAEWCLDWYSSRMSLSEEIDPSGPSSGYYRVFRGGSYRNIGRDCTSFFRSGNEPSKGINLTNFDIFIIGFRVAAISNNETNSKLITRGHHE